MLTLDGTLGEGGGQILRTALALALVLSRPFRIEGLRARRRQPGLRPQHLVCVQAAAAISQAAVEGAEIDSREVTFSPGRVRPGDWGFDIGSAGSTTLVAQTLLPALMLAPRPSRLTLTGGTHNPLAPPYEFLARTFLPLLARMGLRATARLARPGYYPRGGGEVVLEVSRAATLRPLALEARGPLGRIRASARVAGLPTHIADRELAVVHARLRGSDLSVQRDPPETGPGNALLVVVEHEAVTTVFTGFGRRGVPAETVADEAVREAEAYLASGVPVAAHLADQLLLPLALAGGAFVTGSPSSHTTTNAAVIDAFLPGALHIHELGGGRWRVRADGLETGRADLGADLGQDKAGRSHRPPRTSSGRVGE
jgi:RNA 3'-terminal phosphate cyclase (ATP)